MAKTDVNIRIRAVDAYSKTIKAAQRRLKDLEGRAERAGGAVLGASRGAGGVGGAGAAGGPVSGRGGAVVVPGGRSRGEADADGGRRGGMMPGMMPGMGALTGAAAGYVSATGGAQLARSAAEADRRMGYLGIRGGATEEQTREFAAQLRDLSDAMKLPFPQAVQAMEILIDEGLSFAQAMENMPSILKTALASGSAPADLASTAEQSQTSMGITTDQLDELFNTLSASGKSGGFELRDMASYLPSVLTGFNALGYEGMEGMREITAILQTLRKRTGTSAEAANLAENLLNVIRRDETFNNFDDMGMGDYRQRLDEAVANGTDTITAFLDLTAEALDGNMQNLSLLFGDRQAQEAVRSLLNGRDLRSEFLDAVQPEQIVGVVEEDMRRIIGDSQADVQQLDNALGRMGKAIGTLLNETVTPHLVDGASRIEQMADLFESRREEGQGWLESLWGLGRNTGDKLAERQAPGGVDGPEGPPPPPDDAPEPDESLIPQTAATRASRASTSQAPEPPAAPEAPEAPEAPDTPEPPTAPPQPDPSLIPQTAATRVSRDAAPDPAEAPANSERVSEEASAAAGKAVDDMEQVETQAREADEQLRLLEREVKPRVGLDISELKASIAEANRELDALDQRAARPRGAAIRRQNRRARQQYGPVNPGDD